MLINVVESMRPRQWSKNAILFLPLLFTLWQYWRPLSPEMWRFLLLTGGAFIVYCMLSGIVYIINDLADVEKDRAHPRKRLRPIASGRLDRGTAVTAVFVLLVVVLVGSILLDLLSQSFGYPSGAPVLPVQLPFTIVGMAYLVLQVGYTFFLKQLVILDVFGIAAGFLLRAVAGAVIIQVPISAWLYVVTILGALFIGFSKRRNELILLEESAPEHRAILREYTPELLDEMISVTTASTVIAYSLYTFTAENLPKNHAMMATIPFVLYGVFRYLYLVHVKNEGGSPEELLLRDRPLLATIGLWGISVVAILYLFGHP
jgi:4-hydroxybenzoate polyprenyltransferase